MQAFDYSANPSKIIFGKGRITCLPDQLKALGIGKPFIITTPFQKAQGMQLLQIPGMPEGVICSDATMHTPVSVTEKALVLLQLHRCDGLVSVGGGSTIGLSKALALRAKLPQVAIPTTYAGSEVTSILGETQDGVKKTQRVAHLFPNVVIYDLDFTLSLPASMTASSGLNAIAHAAEALYAKDTNPVTNLMAEEGIRALAQSLVVLAENPNDLNARTNAQYGAWLCGICLGSVTMSLHHKLCHVLGGAFDLPHAETHAIVLPYALAFNAPAVGDAMRRIALALGSPDVSPAITLHRILSTLKLPTSLKEIGMPADGVERALDLVFKDAYWNPRALEKQPIRKLLTAALTGAVPIDF